MKRVGRRRRDGRVAPGRGEALVRDRGIVVAVDQIVGDARMLWLLGEDLLEHARGLQLVGVGLVRRQRGRVEGERVEDRRLTVLGVTRRELLHRLPVGERAGAVVHRGGVFVERLDRGDVVALARHPGARGLCPLDGGPAVGERLRRRRPGERIAEQVHRDAPVGDRAAGILLRDGHERVRGRLEPEGVEHGDRALEVRLNRGAARSRETHRADLVVSRGARDAERQHQSQGEGEPVVRHGDLRVSGGESCLRANPGKILA